MNRRTARTGPCATCGKPVTALQSATETRRLLRKPVLTHLHPSDCFGSGENELVDLAAAQLMSALAIHHDMLGTVTDVLADVYEAGRHEAESGAVR